MKIAVTSQNRKTVTGHAGKCRKFWVYEVEGSTVKAKNLLELPIEQSLHASGHDAPHPLDDMNVLIAGGMGQGLQFRLKQKGIQALSTAEIDPDRAVEAWLDGTLEEVPAELHEHEHSHNHAHEHSHHRQDELAKQTVNLMSVDQQFFKLFAAHP
jgi:predicted Fe-Mo cluster-binding NifX family protein